MEKLYLNASEVMQLLGVSQTRAYEIIRTLNAEMDKKGYLTIHGRVNRRYLLERCYSPEEKGAQKDGKERRAVYIAMQNC